MCRLLGLIANQPVDLEFSLVDAETSFQSLGAENPDGWGMGWYDDGKPGMLKEPLAATHSAELPARGIEKRSNLFVCHVRQGTGAERAERNCHPFVYGNWLFAHNGCICDDCVIRLQGSLEPQHLEAIQGETDSEVCARQVGYVGKLTNDMVYARLAPHMLDKLRELVPRDSDGRLMWHFHQHLTEDTGLPELEKHIHAVIALMKASSNWRKFHAALERAFPAQGATLLLAYELPEEIDDDE